MYMPLQMAADLPENYKAYGCLPVYQRCCSRLGRYENLIGRAGRLDYGTEKAKGTENWFVGGITDENKRDYTVDFSFLDKNMKKLIMKMEKMRITSTILKAITSTKENHKQIKINFKMV
jgi:hypothetical protein